MGFFVKPKVVRVGDYLLGSVGIPKTDPFLFGLRVNTFQASKQLCSF